MNLATELTSMSKSPLSLVDDVGALYIDHDCLYRVIGVDKKQEALAILECGLIQELVNIGLFPDTELAVDKCAGDQLVIKHRKIERTIYPFEWSPEMLRLAAICVLEVNDCARKYGYELKDVHPYNVMFENSKPIYVDFGSFIKVQVGYSWCAYKEFLDCYIRVLRLVHYGFISLYKHAFLLRGTGFDGVEIAAATSKVSGVLSVNLLKKLSRALDLYLRGPLISEDAINRRLQSRVAIFFAKFILRNRFLPFRNYSSAKLKRKIKKLNLTGQSFWGNYHQQAGFYDPSGSINLSPRMDWVLKKVEELQSETVIEFAGNQGVLSKRIALLPSVSSVVCSDYDENAVNHMILTSQVSKLYPANFDFMSDTREALSGERALRLKSDLVIALAVTHHLVLTQKYSIDSIISTLAGYSRKNIIIEFMPLGLWDGNSAPSLPVWYTEQWFRDALSIHFNIVDRAQIEENRIIFVGEILRSGVETYPEKTIQEK